MMHLPPNAFVPATRPTPTTVPRSLLVRAWQAYRRGHARQAARTALSELDDRMLADIGITRGEIEGIARGRVPYRGMIRFSGLG